MEPDDLYGLPLAEFVPARGALAKALRADGRRDEAAAVAKLRKPSAAGWAVNQLVRTQAGTVSELFAAGDALRDAQAELLAGRGDARALRDAGARERGAVDALVDAARGALSADGLQLSATTLDRVADTLHAAALDDGAREAVGEGRLERELRHVGLGLGEAAAVAAVPASGGARAAPSSPAEREPAAKPAAAEVVAARRAAKEREAAEQAERKQARAAVAKAAKRGERAAHAVRAAEERRDRAAVALDEAEAALEEARAKAEEATEELRSARAALDESRP